MRASGLNNKRRQFALGHIWVFLLSWAMLITAPDRAFSQSCFFTPCFDNDCGDLNVGFTPLGGPQFCEGQTITLNNTSTDGFDFFVVDWRDGNVDTLFDYEPFQHIYNIPDSLVCDGPPIRPFSLCFKGQKDCPDGISCQSGTYDFGIIVRPEASFQVPFEVCVGSEVPISNTSCNADSYLWDFGNGETSTESNPTVIYDEPGTYNILLTVNNQCGMDMYSVNVQVVDPPVADFEASAQSDPTCVPVILTLENQSENSSSHMWEISPTDTTLWQLTDTNHTMNTPNIEVVFHQAGEYEINMNATNACGTDEFSETIEIFEDIDLEITPPDPFCDETTLTASDFTFSLSGSLENLEWTFVNGSYSSSTEKDFPPVTFSESGEVTLEIFGQCRDTSVSFPIGIVTGEIDFGDIPTEVCQSAPPFQLEAEPPGGQWSGQGIIDAEQGIFDPAGLQGGEQYTIEYSFEISPCEISNEIEIEVLQTETGTFEAPVLCEDGDSSILAASPEGGLWSGSGIIDTMIGVFDPVQSGTGMFEISYHFLDSNNCEVTLTDDLLVEEFPVLQMSDSLQLCLEDFNENLNELLNVSIDPEGGEVSWSGPGVIDADGWFNSAAAGLTTGFYTIWVNYERNACQVIDSAVIEVIEKPDLEVAFTDTIVCAVTGNLQLEVNPAGGNWSGPGIDSQTGSISLDQAGPGQHTYVYEFLGGSSCELSAEVKVEALDPGLNLDVGEAEEVCEGPSIFTLAPAQPAGGVWSGPGVVNEETGQIDLNNLNPGETYEYEYCIESEQVDNCVACATRSFTLNANPIADFEVDDFICTNEPFNPVNNSTGGETYNWDFGDDQVSSQQNPTHAFNNAGDYTIELEVISAAGCTNSTTEVMTTVAAPDADFVLPMDGGCEPFELETINQSAGHQTDFIWVIGVDTFHTVNLDNVELSAGASDTTYQIQLIAINNCGQDQVHKEVNISPRPVAEFGVNEPFGCSPFEVFFSNTSTGQPDLVFWNFGNGNSSELDNPPSQTYTTDNEPVDYTVELVVENQCGIDTHRREITVLPPDVTAFIEMPSKEACAPHLFEPASFSTPGASLSWEVLHENEVIAGSTKRFPEFWLEEPGEYTIVLKASSCGAHSDTTYFTLLESPVLDFDLPRESCVGDQVSFQNHSENGTAPAWDFGDGNQSNQVSPVHIYEESGDYTVELRMQHPETGCPAVLEKEIDILDRPEPNFTISTDEGCPPLEVSFENQSTGVLPLDYSWNFGDGSFESAAANPVHIYENSGAFTVRLVAGYDGLCKDSLVLGRTVEVFDRPVADFDLVADANQDILGDVEFFNLSENADAYWWDFGDGKSSEQENPIHEYDVNRPLTVELIAFNFNNGTYTCTDTIRKSVEPQWITTFFAPNAMSPEYGPSDTRYFKPVGKGIEEIEISIYSPWGEQVWHSTQVEEGGPGDYWDGSFNGEIVPQGAYVWVARITYISGIKKVERGTVTILR
ncbi:MAG: PKD domain-containing protein [Saprospirales bacterium]|nr:MAG: PKD domain-containing protein [Saprospirales bacterium]